MSSRKLVLTGVSYSADNITFQFKQPDGTPDSFTFGLGTARLPYTLKLYGRDFKEEEGHVDVFFRFADEAGKLWSVTFACPVDEVDEITDALNVYFAAFKKRHFPKSNADPSSQSDKARVTATAPSLTTPSPTGPLRTENEHEPTDEADLKPDAATTP